MHYSIEDYVIRKLRARNGGHFGRIELAETTEMVDLKMPLRRVAYQCSSTQGF